MTNFDALKQLSPEEFWQKVQKLNKQNLSEYIDYVAWLKSEDTNLEHFICSNEVIEVYPSEAELIAMQNEHNIRFSSKEKLTDTEIEIYRQQNKKEHIYLGKTQIFGEPYVTTIYHGQVQNVPEKITGNIKKIDGFVSDYVPFDSLK